MSLNSFLFVRFSLVGIALCQAFHKKCLIFSGILAPQIISQHSRGIDVEEDGIVRLLGFRYMSVWYPDLTL